MHPSVPDPGSRRARPSRRRAAPRTGSEPQPEQPDDRSCPAGEPGCRTDSRYPAPGCRASDGAVADRPAAGRPDPAYQPPATGGPGRGRTTSDQPTRACDPSRPTASRPSGVPTSRPAAAIPSQRDSPHPPAPATRIRATDPGSSRRPAAVTCRRTGEPLDQRRPTRPSPARAGAPDPVPAGAPTVPRTGPTQADRHPGGRVPQPGADHQRRADLPARGHRRRRRPLRADPPDLRGDGQLRGRRGAGRRAGQHPVLRRRHRGVDQQGAALPADHRRPVRGHRAADRPGAGPAAERPAVRAGRLQLRPRRAGDRHGVQLRLLGAVPVRAGHAGAVQVVQRAQGGAHPSGAAAGHHPGQDATPG